MSDRMVIRGCEDNEKARSRMSGCVIGCEGVCQDVSGWMRYCIKDVLSCPTIGVIPLEGARFVVTGL